METKEQQTKKIQDGQYESSANSRFTIKSHRRKELYFRHSPARGLSELHMGPARGLSELHMGPARGLSELHMGWGLLEPLIHSQHLDGRELN